VNDIDELELRRERERASRSNEHRARTSIRPFESDTPSRDVPCIGCGAVVQLSGFAWEAAKIMSRGLLDRGEQPLRNDELTRCPACAEAFGADRTEKYAALCERVNEAQREANERGLVDRPLIEWLRKRHMREWADGIESAASRRNALGTKGKGKNAMGDL
jgi:hypothetical protein